MAEAKEQYGSSATDSVHVCTRTVAKNCNGQAGCNWYDSGADRCRPCQAGYYCPSNEVASRTMENCGKGYYCPEGSFAPTPCPAGTYCDTANLHSSRICPKYYYCPGTQRTAAAACPAGYYCDAEGISSLTNYKCPAGSYCPSSATTTPTNCPANSYCVAGSSTHKLCSSLGTKHTKSDAGSKDKTDCYYQPAAGYRYSTSTGTEVECNSGMLTVGYCDGTQKKTYNNAIPDNFGRQDCPPDTDEDNRTVFVDNPAKAITSCYVKCTVQTTSAGTFTPKATTYHYDTEYEAYEPCKYTASCNTGYHDECPDIIFYTDCCVVNTYKVRLNLNKPNNATKNVVYTVNNMIQINIPSYYDITNITYTENIKDKLFPSRYSLTGWTLSSWNTKQDCTGTDYTSDSTINKLASTDGATVNLYACWTPNKYTITWDFDGGKPKDWATCQIELQENPGFMIYETPGQWSWVSTYSGTITARYDYSLPAITENCRLSKAGYTFNGIGTEGSGSIDYYDKNYTSKTWDIAGNTTLKVKWEPNVIPVILSPGSYKLEQNVSPSKIELKYGTGWYKEGDSSSSSLQRIIKITTIPIVSGKVFKGFYYDGTQMINKAGSFTSNMTATLFPSGSYRFDAQYDDCTCSSGSHVSECTATGTTTENKCEYQTKCNTGYSIGGGRDDTQGVGTNYYNWTASGTNASNTIDCKPRTFNFTFKANAIDASFPNGASEESRTSVAYDSFPGDLTDNEKPRRTGYTFTGYTAAKGDNGTMYFNADGEFVDNSENEKKWQRDYDATMYAHWTPNTYRVALDNQGAASGSGGTTEFFYQYETKNTCYYYTDSELSACIPGTTDGTKITIPSRKGYVFCGYWTEAGGSGTQYIDSTGSMSTKNIIYEEIAEDTTLYACWAPDAITITLRDDDCSDETSCLQDLDPTLLTLLYSHGYYPHGTTFENMGSSTAITKLTTIPIVKGKVFDGFYYDDTKRIDSAGNFMSNMTATLVSSATDFTAKHVQCQCSSNKELPAHVKSCEVTGTTIKSDAVGQNKCKFKTVCQSGYSINGDADTSGTTSSGYDWTGGSAGNPIGTLSDCKPRKFKFTFKANGNKASFTNGGNQEIRTDVAYDSVPVDLTANEKPKRTGYTFDGYSAAQDSKATMYFNENGKFIDNKENGYTWQRTYDADMYAQWTANTYTVTLDNQGADSAGTESISATYDSEMRNITVPQKTGYTFQGYYTERNGGGRPYYGADGTSANTWDIPRDTTLFAKWSVNTYKVYFDGNCTQEGLKLSGSMEPQIDREYGDGKALTKNNFECGYLVFIGWNTHKDGGSNGDDFADESTDNITTGTGSVTLYAQWLGCAAGCFCSDEDITGCTDASDGQKCCETCPTLFTSAPGSTEKKQCYLNGIDGIITLTDEMGQNVNYTIPENVTLYWIGNEE